MQGYKGARVIIIRKKLPNMSFKQICFTLALTASVSVAEKMKLAELMNLQSEIVDKLDLGHTEPEVGRLADRKHREMIAHGNETFDHLDLGHTEPEVHRSRDSKHGGTHSNEPFDHLDLGHKEPEFDY